MTRGTLGVNVMNLVMLHGLPGVGKLTIARELAKQTGYRLFHNHLTVDLVASVFDFGTAPFIELRESIWLSVLGRAVAEQVPGVLFTFAFERTVPEGFLPRLRTTVEQGGGRLYLVELTCDREELERRVESPSRAPFGKLRSVELMRRLIADGSLDAPAGLRSDLTIDTTDLHPAEAAGKIAAALAL